MKNQNGQFNQRRKVKFSCLSQVKTWRRSSSRPRCECCAGWWPTPRTMRRRPDTSRRPGHAAATSSSSLAARKVRCWLGSWCLTVLHISLVQQVLWHLYSVTYGNLFIFSLLHYNFLIKVLFEFSFIWQYYTMWVQKVSILFHIMSYQCFLSFLFWLTVSSYSLGAI